jgi:pilus assembly protein CpaD
MKRMFALALALGLAGCYSDQPGHPLGPQELHPLKVSQTAMTLALDLPASTSQLSADDAARYDRFIDDYLSHGSGALELVAGEHEGAAAPRVKLLIERAARRGVSGADIKVRHASLGAGAVQPLVLSYRRFVVELPTCGNFNDNPAFNPSNANGVNFGCSVQRNLGQMVVNPGDLQAAQPVGSISAARSDRVIDLYKQGRATESEKSDSSRAQISTVRGGAQ